MACLLRVLVQDADARPLGTGYHLNVDNFQFLHSGNTRQDRLELFEKYTQNLRDGVLA
jgi:hypothetical protein